MAKEKLCGIYCIENTINHKKYIGQSININARWRSHKNQLIKNVHSNAYLQNAWNKYGEENFSFKILELCDENLLDTRERHYISILSTLTTKNGYNLDSGGKINKHHSEETKRKISATNTGHVVSEETRKKISYNRTEKTCGKNHYMWGKKLSPEHIEIIRQYASSVRGKDVYCAKEVICINTFEIFPTIREAAQKYNCDETCLSRCCKGKYNYCGIFEDGTKLQWAFYEKGKEYKLKENIKTKGNQRFVHQYTTDMKFVSFYESIKEAEKQTGISRQQISNVCNGKYSQTNGYIFKYVS